MRGFSADDLFTEGCIGMLNALEEYSLENKTLFITYASHRITGEIKHAIRDKTEIIRRPAWCQEFAQLNHKMLIHTQANLGRVPTDEEMAAVMKMPISRYQELLLTTKVVSVSSINPMFAVDGQGVDEVMMPKSKLDGCAEGVGLDENERLEIQADLDKLQKLIENGNPLTLSRSLGIDQAKARRLIKKANKSELSV